ncbi:MAG: hypothetical protein K8R74_11870, partial [Bacteroidales bacterium]|nr:hypothetical protein [Bacteroidales bacterium]
MKFTEEKLEQVFIELLGAEKITYLPGHEISRSPDEVLIKEDLRTFLHKHYQSEKITASEIDAII